MHKAYIGNLSYSTSQSDLEKFLEECGPIADLKIITDRDTGRPKGFAFATFETEEGLQKALKLDSHELDGRQIKINVAQDRR